MSKLTGLESLFFALHQLAPTRDSEGLLSLSKRTCAYPGLRKFVLCVYIK